MRFIEVIATVRVERDIESYEATLELSTSSGRKVTCFDQALESRETVIGILKDCGLTNSEIREGGGEAVQNFWSSTKSVVHRIAIRNKSMDVLMSAMAATERHFSALPRPFFGRTKHNFTFHAPVPIYATNVSADDALREAMQNARNTAEVFANESGYRLGRLISVAEHYSQRRPDANAGPRYGYPDDTSVDFCLSEDDAIGAIAYTGLPKNTANAARRFHVRFAAEDAEPSDARETSAQSVLKSKSTPRSP
ncbi:SIMPL domain-containing protein [Novipirellula caenicola]|uniref:SIMPL domain-containing protein n=1 Tax=Novipirellula caenicola TaxID=1536901 RepID=UPI0031E8AA3A